jgi:hypothetical protein
LNANIPASNQRFSLTSATSASSNFAIKSRIVAEGFCLKGEETERWMVEADAASDMATKGDGNKEWSKVTRRGYEPS